MFELSFGKMMIIAVVALIVLGPEKLPKVARTLGHLLGRARGYANQVKQDIDREMQMDELRKLQEQAKDAARSFETAVNDAGRSVEQEAASVQNSVNTSLAQAEQNAAATHATENSIAPPHPVLTAQDEVAALEKSIAEQAAEQAAESKPMISAEQMTASLPQAHAASKPQAQAPSVPQPANSADAAKKVA
jgi:sec-independent protein translocase protein TatB